MRLSARLLFKYKRTFPRQPYVTAKELTDNFQEGVGYMRNFVQNEPVFFVVLALVSVLTGYAIVNYRKELNSDPDYLRVYQKKYTVKRSADVSDPTKDCFT
ncbi:uncharacterized protein LOC127866110 [Dreissena polymorpha]|uniref:Uncharacterized protein n=1 Tax=Dreissena polymorpha TaxID=45954 RepID=A0A9D4LQM6_DREPO|nr:uncharacterized protein LOC127866110 [Dreissena polymorpha]KAH3861948.1 hypothetical protein DPMN_024902 [Dreissena polymorpha]